MEEGTHRNYSQVVVITNFILEMETSGTSMASSSGSTMNDEGTSQVILSLQEAKILWKRPLKFLIATGV